MSTRSVSVPRNVDDVRLVFRTIRLVVSQPLYALLAVVGFVIGLSVFVLPQNVSLLETIVFNGTIPLENRLRILVNLYPYIGSAFSPLNEALLGVSGVLFGINTSMLVYHLRRERVSFKTGGGSVIGMLLGTMGAGCAACGAAVVTAAFSLFGATGLLAMLPLEGNEFTVLSLLALVLSIYWLADGMRGNEIDGCPVDF